MSIGRKNIFIRYYVLEQVQKLKKLGIEIKEEEFEKLIDEFSEKRLGTLELIHEIDDEFKKLLKDYYTQKDLYKTLMNKLEENRELQELPLEYSGITLNSQDIDLMRIEETETPEELEEVLETTANKQPTLETFRLTDKEFLEAKRKTYELYQDTLEDSNAEIKDPSIKVRKKIEYLKDSGELTKKEQQTLDKILSETSEQKDIPNKLKEAFGEEKSHRMYEIIRECTPIEKEGIKKITPEATANLYNQVKDNYNSITIDDEVKYGSVVLGDGTFDFRRLGTVLDFAKNLGKKVRLNALIFYMDCPKELYDLDATEENKKLTKDKLIKYIDETTKYIGQNGYSDTVRSIDIFNELPNRFPIEEDTLYKYRGDIDQTKDKNGIVPDNINSGWSKHLSISDLCDAAVVARTNLPDTDFTYNDDNLTDPNKLEVTKDIIGEIQSYEQEHSVKLIDSIGTQMHIDNDVTTEQIENMFRELSKYGLPIEITEFDLAMTKDVDGLTDEEIEVMRQLKMNEIITCIENLKDECNIRGLTIWSKTDSQNFRVKLANEELLTSGNEPIDTLHGGYFTEEMEPKAKQFVKKKTYNYHTHTYRCGHASDAKDEEYVDAARSAGITTLGFSDHIPNTEYEYDEDDIRMNINDTEEYISSIEKLQEENPDMEILSGYEAEYDPAKEEFLSDMRDDVDYMILGQHYVRDGMNKTDSHTVNYPIEYAESVCRAINTGIFDIVAHPDIFFRERDTLETEEEKQLFDENAKIASRMICEKAKDMNIPVELNLSASYKNENYPNKIFWEIAKETEVKVVVGADAHDPKRLETMQRDRETTMDKIDNLDLNFVSDNYNPKIARDNNIQLQEALIETRIKSTSYEIYIIIQLLEKLSAKESSRDISQLCGYLIERLEQLYENEDIDNKISKMTKEEDVKKLKEQVQTEDYNKVLQRRKNLLLQAKKSVIKGSKVCKSKEKLFDFVRKDMQDSKKHNNQEVSNMLSESVEPPSKVAAPKEDEKPKVLKIPNPDGNDKGYIETMSIYTTIIAAVVVLLLIIMILM